MDDLAAKLGLDPMQVRLKNLPPNDPEAIKNDPMSFRALRNTIYTDEIRKAAELAQWDKKWHPPGKGDGKGPLLGFILSKNLHRRHLSEAQRALVAAKIKRLFEERCRPGLLVRPFGAGQKCLIGHGRHHVADIDWRTIAAVPAVQAEVLAGDCAM